MILTRLTRFFLLFCIVTSKAWAAPITLYIGTDQNYWYPFSYSDNGVAKGIHIDIVADALTNLKYHFTFEPHPWKRCLKEAKQGTFDAVVSASYKPERAKFLLYPQDVPEEKKSQWRIMQVEYVVISPTETIYEFEGDLTTLPPPVRAPLGYSIIDDLKAKGVAVVTAPDIRQLMKQLINTGRGVVVTAYQNGENLARQEPFKNKVQVHAKSFKSKSYFMAFSTLSKKLTQVQRQAIWNEIARLREDKTYMDTLFSRYCP